MNHLHLLHPEPAFQRLARAALSQHGLKLNVLDALAHLPPLDRDLLILSERHLTPADLAWIQHNATPWLRILLLDTTPTVPPPELRRPHVQRIPQQPSTLDTLDALERAVLQTLDELTAHSVQEPVHTPPRMRMHITQEPQPGPRGVRTLEPLPASPGGPDDSLEQQLDTVRTTYAKRLPSLFDALEQHIRQAQPHTSDAANQALHITRQIQGTSGSFGFLSTANAMSALERGLHALQSAEPGAFHTQQADALALLDDARATLDLTPRTERAPQHARRRALRLDGLPERIHTAWLRAARLLNLRLAGDAAPLGRVSLEGDALRLDLPAPDPGTLRWPRSDDPLQDAFNGLQALLLHEARTPYAELEPRVLYALDPDTGAWRPSALLRLLRMSLHRTTQGGDRFALGLLALQAAPSPQQHARLRAWLQTQGHLLLAGWWTPHHLLIIAEGRAVNRVEQSLDLLANDLTTPGQPPLAWGYARANTHEEPLDGLIQAAWSRLYTEQPAR